MENENEILYLECKEPVNVRVPYNSSQRINKV